MSNSNHIANRINATQPSTFDPAQPPRSSLTEQIEAVKAMLINLEQRIAAERSPETRKTTAEARILSVLAERRKVKYVDLPELTGLTKSASDYAADELARRGLLVPVKVPEKDAVGRVRMLLVAYHPDAIAM
jgi:hypothetical protein